MARKRPLTILFASGTASLLLVGALGLPYFGMAMTMSEHGDMAVSDCYMPGMTTLCNMDVFDHLSWWQSMFTSTPATDTILTLLLFAGAALASLVVIRYALSPPRKPPVKLRQPVYLPPASPLQELFSNGILHPKLFLRAVSFLRLREAFNRFRKIPLCPIHKHTK